jgi:hypothetical protein
MIRLIQSFIDSVTQLARLPGTYHAAADLLIDFSNKLLMARNTCVQHMLNSQRCHLLAMLDDALLAISIDEWDKPASSASICTSEVPWDKHIAPVSRRLAEGLALTPVWTEGEEAAADLKALRWMDWYDEHPTVFQSSLWMKSCYFVRSRKFLQESEQIYWEKRKVNACLQERLPKEIADEIIDDVLESENLHCGRLRRKYFPAGKGKA